MSVTVVAGFVPIDGPLPRERLHSLLTVPGVLVPQNELEDHWESGVTVYGYPAELPEPWDLYCESGTFRAKHMPEEDPPQGSFYPFILSVPIECSAMGIGDPEAFARRAGAVMRATRAWGVERVLAGGQTTNTQPFLADANMDDLTGGTAVSAGVGISYLEQAIGETGRQGLIHITPAVAAALQVLPLGDEGADAPIYTAAGTPVAIGAGYQDVDGAQAAAGDTEDYIFATGPVEVRISDDVEIIPDDISQALDRAQNDVVYRAETIAVVSWDTALQAGALVDWAL